MTEQVEISAADPIFTREVHEVLFSFLKNMPDGLRLMSGSLTHKDYAAGATDRWKLNADGTYDISLLSDITASAAELNVLDGFTGTTADLNEMSAFFQSTDMTGAEAEDLTDGGLTSLHSHVVMGLASTALAGKELFAGLALSIESDGEAWPCRFTGCTSSSLACSSASAPNAPYLTKPSHLIDVSDTVKLAVVQDVDGVGSDDIYLSRAVVDPAAGTFSSESNATLTLTGGATEAYDYDVKRLDSTRVAIAWVDTTGAVTAVRVKVLDLSSGITQGTILDVDTTVAATKLVAISVDDPDEFFVWYNDATNGLRAAQVTASGTTLTLGTVNAVTADTNDDVYAACNFGGSGYHLLCFYDDSEADKTRYVCASNSGGTLTFGTSVVAGLYSALERPKIVSVADDECVAANGYVNVLRNAYVRHIARNGTTLTVTVYGGYVGDMDSISGYPSIVHFGGKEFAIAVCRYSALTGYLRVKTLSLNGTTWTEGTVLTTSGGVALMSTVSLICPFTPSSLIGAYWTGGEMIFYVIAMTGNINSFVGFVEDETSDGSVATFDTDGRVDYLSGLTAGSRHAVQAGGWANPNRTFGARYCGVARSSTEMFVQS